MGVDDEREVDAMGTMRIGVRDRARRRVVVAVGVVTLAVASACAPGSPAVITTASAATTVDGAGYSATSPLWRTDVASNFEGAGTSGFFNLEVSDPLAPALFPNEALWPASGAYALAIALRTDGTAPQVGATVVGTGTPLISLQVRVRTWEDKRQPIDDQSYERRWLCQTFSAPGLPAATGTVRITQVTMSGTRVRSIGISWDLQCVQLFETSDGPVAGTTRRHWVGSATYNS